MKAQVILHGGPYEGTLITLGSVEGDWPAEIRVASGDRSYVGDEPCMAYHYARHDVDTTGVIFMGSYKYTHSHKCSRTLVDRWL